MTLLVHDVTHRFGAETAVDRASLDAAPGEIVCLFGPSGCGKTTLLRLIAGFERLQAGRVSLDGVVLAEPRRDTPPERRPIGFVFQDYALFPHLSVAANVGFGLKGLSDSGRRSAVAEALASVELAGFEDRYPHQLSGGQQQRVALARAAARRPKALLLDEPFASIDAVLRRRLRADLRRMLKARAAATLIVTHDPEEAIELADRVAVMRKGRIIELATPSDLRAHPRTPEGAAIFPGAERLDFETVDGVVLTAFGPIEQPPPAARGAAVIAPGGVEIASDGAANAIVVDARFDGENWFIVAESLSRTGERVRARSREEFAVRTLARVAIDPRRAVLFGE